MAIEESLGRDGGGYRSVCRKTHLYVSILRKMDTPDEHHLSHSVTRCSPTSRDEDVAPEETLLGLVHHEGLHDQSGPVQVRPDVAAEDAVGLDALVAQTGVSVHVRRVHE